MNQENLTETLPKTRIFIDFREFAEHIAVLWPNTKFPRSDLFKIQYYEILMKIFAARPLAE